MIELVLVHFQLIVLVLYIMKTSYKLARKMCDVYSVYLYV